jgi:O-antigen/teichoic acid export membrane protein
LVIVATTLVNTVIQFATLRTDEALIRFMGASLTQGSHQEAITFFYVGLTADALVSAGTVLLALLLLPVVAHLYPEGAALRPLATIYLVSIPFLTLEDTFASLLSVFKRFGAQAALTVLVALSRLVALIMLAPSGTTAVVWGYVAVSVLSFALTCGVGLRLLRVNLKSFAAGNLRGAWRRFVPFTFHTSLTASLIAVAKNVEILVLGALRPVGEVSFFKIAQSASSLISMPTSPVVTILYPELNEAWARGDRSRARSLVRRYVLYALLVSAGIYVLLFVSVDWLVHAIYGSGYQPVGELVRILGLGVILGNVFHWARQATQARGKPELATFYNFGALALRIACVIPWVFYLGAIGAAWSYDLATCFAVALIVAYVLPRLDLRAEIGRSVREDQARGDSHSG